MVDPYMPFFTIYYEGTQGHTLHILVNVITHHNIHLSLNVTLHRLVNDAQSTKMTLINLRIM